MSAQLATPPSAWPGHRQDGLAPLQQRLLVVGVVAAHAAAAWGLLHVCEVRDDVAEAVPMMLSIVSPAEPKPPMPAPSPMPAPLPQKAPPPLPAPMRSAPPSPEPATFVVPVQPAPQPPTPPAEPAPAPAPPAPPTPPLPARTMAASEVQFLKTPVLQYPAASRRARETGRVLLRLFIDERGLPSQVEVNRSSGFARLDDAAVATIQQALFKPHTDNGQPVGAWVLVPFDFALEK